MFHTRWSRREIRQYILFTFDIVYVEIVTFEFQHHLCVSFGDGSFFHSLQKWLVIREDIEMNSTEQSSEVQNSFGDTESF